MYVCVCNAITEAQVRASVEAGAETLEDLQLDTGVATCCGTCAEVASSYLPNLGIAESQPAQASVSVTEFKEVRWVSRNPHGRARAAA